MERFFELSSIEQIEYLKELNFFEMKNLNKKEVLRKLGFFEINNNERIKFLEAIGVFDLDINDDPPDLPLEEGVDYLKRKTITGVKKNQIAQNWTKMWTNNNEGNGRAFKIDRITNLESIKNLTTGAIIVCNHFNVFDTFAIEKALTDNGIPQGDKKIWKVIREGNYTNPPEDKKFGLYFRHGNNLPLSSTTKTMEEFKDALSTLLNDGNIVIVCGEQAMWENYKKPRPTKFGAFKWAKDNCVPIIPVFTTISGEHQNEYTINVGDIIEPDEHIETVNDTLRMRNQYFEFAKNIYETTYGIPLEYDTMQWQNLSKYVKCIPEMKNMMKKYTSRDEKKNETINPQEK